MAFALTGPDNESFMYRGDMNPPACGECGLVTQEAWVDPSFALATRAFDYSYTYDGAAIVSERFKEAAERFSGSRFESLPSEPGFYVMVVEPTVAFDAERRRTRVEQLCGTCGRYYSVAGAHPVFLVDRSVPSGFSRTDLEFGTGREQHPVYVADPQTARALEVEGFKGLELLPVEG